MIIKIDLEKAYDRLERGFINETLLDVGVAQRLASVITECISKASFHFVWNGEFPDVIKQSGVLWQGDSISHYIFVLGMEHLAHRIRMEVEVGNWKTLKASRYSPGISHLFFTNDFLLFAKSTCSQVRIIRRCLDEFAIALAQKIYPDKLKLYFSTNISKKVVVRISEDMGILVTEDLGRYLGTQLVHRRHGKALYMTVLEK